MDFISEAIKRMDMPKIRSFLLYGSDEYSENTRPYHETLEKSDVPILRRLEALCPDMTDLDNAVAELNDALTTYQNVFMELGMKAGARLMCQLLMADETPPEGNGEK